MAAWSRTLKYFAERTGILEAYLCVGQDMRMLSTGAAFITIDYRYALRQLQLSPERECHGSDQK